MARLVLYRIIDQPDGRFAITAEIAPGKTFTRPNLDTLANVDAAIDNLRVLMAACGAQAALDPLHALHAAVAAGGTF